MATLELRIHEGMRLVEASSCACTLKSRTSTHACAYRLRCGGLRCRDIVTLAAVAMKRTLKRIICIHRTASASAACTRYGRRAATPPPRRNTSSLQRCTPHTPCAHVPECASVSLQMHVHVHMHVHLVGLVYLYQQHCTRYRRAAAATSWCPSQRRRGGRRCANTNAK